MRERERERVLFTIPCNIIMLARLLLLCTKKRNLVKCFNCYSLFVSGLWLDYIETELVYPGGDPGRVGGLHWRAVKELQPQLTADFISKYSLLHLS